MTIPSSVEILGKLLYFSFKQTIAGQTIAGQTIAGQTIAGQTISYLAPASEVAGGFILPF
jgi:hypothetical protein